jgi:hypothetical protein
VVMRHGVRYHGRRAERAGAGSWGRRARKERGDGWNSRDSRSRMPKRWRGRAKKMVARVSRRKKTIFVAVFDKNNCQ